MPSEGAGLTEEVVARLQDTATILTQERKRRGRTVPEGLTPAEQIRGFTTLASHPVSWPLYIAVVVVVVLLWCLDKVFCITLISWC